MSLTRRTASLSAATLLAAGAAAAPSPVEAAPDRPNILYFLVDDMGWYDTTINGSEYYETPSMERLAEMGVNLTRAYATPLCSPTRASILTGKYAGRLNLTAPQAHLPMIDPPLPPINSVAPPHVAMIGPNVVRALPLEEYTMAEALRDVGYDTIFLGKWHLGRDREYWPEAQGFNTTVGVGGAGPPSYYSPYRVPLFPDGPEGEYITDRITDEAIRYLETRTTAEEPFFMALWHFAVHGPFQGRKDLYQKYRDKTDPRGLQDCPTMGAMLEPMDISLGRILDTLEETGLADNTIIVFFSDNGGNMYNDITDPVTGHTTTPTNNAPLAFGKGNIGDGGIKVPALVVWPGVIEGGTTDDTLVSCIDWYKTVLTWGGATPRPGQVIDGVDLVPLLAEGKALDREAIFTHFPHSPPAPKAIMGTSVHRGDYKAIRYYGEGPDRSNKVVLYNLREDEGETTDLAAQMPELAAELDALIEQHLRETGSVVPFPNPNYNPRAQRPGQGPPPEPVAGWVPAKNIQLEHADGVLKATMTGHDPFMTAADVTADGPALFRMRYRGTGDGDLQVYYTDSRNRGFSPNTKIEVDLDFGPQWRTVDAPLPARGRIGSLRVDPGHNEGRVEIEWIRLYDEAGTTVQHEWHFGGAGPGGAGAPSPSRPSAPVSENAPAEWEEGKSVRLETVGGVMRVHAGADDPWFSLPRVEPLPGPVRVAFRARSTAQPSAAAGSQVMWRNRNGHFSMAQGRGMEAPMTHDGQWREYSFTIDSPDVESLRFDPVRSGPAVIEYDWIRVYSPATAPVPAWAWEFGGPASE